MKLLLLFISIYYLLFSPSLALNNGLGRTPAMGYNTWYDLGCSDYMQEKTLYEVMDAYEVMGLAKAGYQFVNLDDCWAGTRENVTGKLIPDEDRFPHGLVPLIERAHSLGLKFGVYTDRGNLTCGGRPGAFGHEELDANTYAEWGVDFLKEDSCNATQEHDIAFKEYALMRDSLNKTGRPIFFALCGWYSWYAHEGAELGNEWRVGPDDYNWGWIINNINIDAGLAEYAGPGGFNNPCLLLGQNATGHFIITEQQSRTQFGMWAILSAPLMLSQNIRNMTAFLYETYTNLEVIAVNQDPLGKQGTRVVGGDLNVDTTHGYNTTNVWTRELHDGSHALIFINVGKTTELVTCDEYCFSTMGYNSTSKIAARDLWLHQNVWMNNGTLTYTAKVPAKGGSVMLKIYEMY